MLYRICGDSISYCIFSYKIWLDESSLELICDESVVSFQTIAVTVVQVVMKFLKTTVVVLDTEVCHKYDCGCASGNETS